MHDLTWLVLIAAFISAIVGAYFKNVVAVAVSCILLVVAFVVKGSGP